MVLLLAANSMSEPELPTRFWIEPDSASVEPEPIVCVWPVSWLRFSVMPVCDPEKLRVLSVLPA